MEIPLTMKMTPTCRNQECGMLTSKVINVTGKDKSFTVNMFNMVEECKMSERTSVVAGPATGSPIMHVADCYTVNLGTLISGDIFLSSLV